MADLHMGARGARPPSKKIQAETTDHDRKPVSLMTPRIRVPRVTDLFTDLEEMYMTYSMLSKHFKVQ